MRIPSWNHTTHVDDILAAGPRVVWFQLGIRNPAAAEAFARAGIQVVQDRCLLVEHRRLALAARQRVASAARAWLTSRHSPSVSAVSPKRARS